MNICLFFILFGLDYGLTDKEIKQACDLEKVIVQIEQEQDVPRYLLAALIYHESRFKPTVISRRGACGITQIMPKYTKRFSSNQKRKSCKDLQREINESIVMTARILKHWMKSKKIKTFNKALECYNSGNRCRSPAYYKKVRRLSDKMLRFDILAREKF